MTDQLEADTQQLIDKAKSLGFKQAANMKPETLIKKIEEAEAEQAAKVKAIDGLHIDISDEDKKVLVDRGTNFKALKQRCKEYKIDQIIYDPKRRVFGCLRDGDLIDWIDVGAF